MMLYCRRIPSRRACGLSQFIQFSPHVHHWISVVPSSHSHTCDYIPAKSIKQYGTNGTTIISQYIAIQRPYSSLPNNHNAIQSSTPDTPTTTSSDGVVAIPIDFDVASKIEGEESQIVTVTLEPNQILRAESGAMIFMTTGVQMETTTGGGLSAGFKRMLTGQNMFISDFSYHGNEGTTGQVALGTDFPSKIIRLNVEEYGGKIVCQKGALLCASHTIDIEMEFAKKLTAGFFGGEGFVLQALTGKGDVFIKAGGTLVNKILAEGEVLRVSSGCLVAFEQGVEFDVQTMPGFKNVVFGGEGLFVTTLTGPGTVWLQGMPPDRMINEIARRVPSGGIGMGIPIGMGGSTGGDNDGDGGGESEEASNAENDNDSSQLPSETEASIQTDRNAAVSSSEVGTDTDTNVDDPDSPSALFGDAASPEPTVYDDHNENTNFEDSTTFTNDGQQLDDFDDTFTTNEQSEWDTFQEDETSFETGGEVNEESGSGILEKLWDLFRDD